MSANDISKMNDKQLRNEVQLLRDELAIMMRKYEDILYNLDDDNFSSKLIREKNNMKTEIEVNTEGIKTKVSNGDFETYKTQTADTITSEVKKLTAADETLFTKIIQTADSIESTVKSVVSDTYITDKLGDTYLTNATFDSKFEQKATGIYTTVSSTYETKDNANNRYSALSGSISSVQVTANLISSKVSGLENGEYENFTLFEQKSDGFYLTGDVHLSGDLISGGTLTGVEIQNSDGTAKIILGHPATGSTVGDLNLIRIDGAGNEQTIFSIADNWQSIDLVGMGKTFLRATGATTKPQGTWDFSACDDVIIPSGTISATARFG